MTCRRCEHDGTAHSHLPDKVDLRACMHVRDRLCSDCIECKGSNDV